MAPATKIKEMKIPDGLDLKEIEESPFKFQDNYHYYEPKVYDMDRYFEGFNLRQLKRIMHIFNNFSIAYQSYMHLMGNKIRSGSELSQLEHETFEIFKLLYDKVKSIVNFMNSFQRTNDKGENAQPYLFGPHYTKNMHGRCWVRDDDDLKNVKHIRFTTERGKKWRCGDTQEYYPSNDSHISSINGGMKTVLFFGHWLGYFKVALIENFLSTDELNEFNPNIISDFCNDVIKLRINLIEMKIWNERIIN
jgi:hypothetical protein|tara:strand:- start:3274 stop:4020 length:747 start_codon:yes stop_codon:yes gene_type:complete